jgi:hypothetical protein
MENWKGQHSIETVASPEVIWSFFRDVDGWAKWNAGIEAIKMQGPFATGTEFLMTFPDQETITSRFTEVRENELFIDETRVDDVVVTVDHRIERLGANKTRITYSVEAIGPGSTAIGPAVSSDFPDVLKSLVQLAEFSLGVT